MQKVLHMPQSKRSRRRKAKLRKKKARKRKAREAAAQPHQLPQPPFDPAKWPGVDGPLASFIIAETKDTLRSYVAQPNIPTSMARGEDDAARGGYRHRQIVELVQNGADATLHSGSGRIEILLRESFLYCADDGRPVSRDGVKALMFPNLSPKGAKEEIGRFGRGFRSVLAVSSTPEFFSRQGSFGFDRDYARNRIQEKVELKHYPVFSLPKPLDPLRETETDPDLKRLMGWASNIVRLPLLDGTHTKDLEEQIENFAGEFMLFTKGVHHLTITGLAADVRQISRKAAGEDCWTLNDRGTETKWRIVRKTHELSSRALADRRTTDADERVEITWAAPVGSWKESAGARKFWAYFPTQSRSMLGGILNAPWKVNEERSNLLEGSFNEELVDAAAELVAHTLPRFATNHDPGTHLDLLPPRRRTQDQTLTLRLSEQLFRHLWNQAVIPDKTGRLRRAKEIKYPPREVMGRDRRHSRQLKDAVGAWYRGRAVSEDWVHKDVLSFSRYSRVDRLSHRTGKLFSDLKPGETAHSALGRVSLREWLEALCPQRISENPARDSRQAIRVAHLLEKARLDATDAEIVLLSGPAERWAPIAGGALLWPEGQDPPDDLETVSPAVATDEIGPLLQKMGVREAKPEDVFRGLLKSLKRGTAEKGKVWLQARGLAPQVAAELILEMDTEWFRRFPIKTAAGTWEPIAQMMRGGTIIDAASPQDLRFLVNEDYHSGDGKLLSELGLRGYGVVGQWDGSWDPGYKTYLDECRSAFINERQPGTAKPRRDRLEFAKRETAGPFTPLPHLSKSAKCALTWDLLKNDRTFLKWELRHDTQEKYGSKRFPALGQRRLKQYGEVEPEVTLADVINRPTDYPAVLQRLYKLPTANLIRNAWNLPESIWEPEGQEEAVPLLDRWPGFASQGSDLRSSKIVRCAHFMVDGIDDTEQRAVKVGTIVYYRADSDPVQEIKDVAAALEITLGERYARQIHRYRPPQSVAQERDRIRECATDEERLLAAVGTKALRKRIPDEYLAYKETVGHGPLSDEEIASASISFFHTAALRHHRRDIQDLKPPTQWAGGAKAVAFVESLGFGPEWAGEPNVNRDPFETVEGPLSLPKLHDYQEKVATRLRGLLADDTTDDKRGLISLPTGSGKTRVGVQGIVEAVVNDGYRSHVLWVADRDELCEQAVQAWLEVWRSEGPSGRTLRVSRLWGGMEAPAPADDFHVAVASLQTLTARLSREDYAFLQRFGVVVFDEAHRSVARTPREILKWMGFRKQWQKEPSNVQQPVLLGLTATPYRSDDDETRRLVNQYNGNRLDLGVFPSTDPRSVIRYLQDRGVLARVKHQEIRGGAVDMSKSPGWDLPWLPRKAEDELAYDATRTIAILNAYKDHVQRDMPDAPTLVFGTSVRHSQILAAELTAAGVPARAISSSTEKPVRRRVVEEYREGKLRVLVNYGIFREGFDAPKTRVVIIARPVFSPNLYFQMLGRGMRGPVNGGNEECLVLDVSDNLENFDRDLAYRGQEWLWHRPR